MALGFPHPDHLNAVLTARQIAEWMEYWKVEPFGQPAEEMRLGILGATFVSPYMKKGSQPPDPKDFTFSLHNAGEKIMEPETLNKLLEGMFENAIPISEWRRKHRERKKG